MGTFTACLWDSKAGTAVVSSPLLGGKMRKKLQESPSGYGVPPSSCLTFLRSSAAPGIWADLGFGILAVPAWGQLWASPAGLGAAGATPGALGSRGDVPAARPELLGDDTGAYPDSQRQLGPTGPLPQIPLCRGCPSTDPSQTSAPSQIPAHSPVFAPSQIPALSLIPAWVTPRSLLKVLEVGGPEPPLWVLV